MLKTKKIILVSLFAAVTLSSGSLIIHASNSHEKQEQGLKNLPSFYNTIDYFHSNKYSNVETNQVVTNQYSIEAGDEELLTNSAGTYYVNRKTLAMKFKDNEGYIHNTSVNQYDGETRLLNNTNYGIACSAVVDSAFASARCLQFAGRRRGNLLNRRFLRDRRAGLSGRFDKLYHRDCFRFGQNHYAGVQNAENRRFGIARN